MIALYIHGFNSAGFGNKVDAWRDAFGPASVINPTLPVQPAAAMETLDWLVSRLKGPDFCLLGSSLGGFYALNLALRHQVPAVLINPAVKDVAQGLAYAKEGITNYKTEEAYAYTDLDSQALESLELSAQDWQQLQGLIYAYLDAEDEVLPAPKIAAFFKEQGLYSHMFAGGSHRFEHMPEAIADFKTQFKNFKK